MADDNMLPVYDESKIQTLSALEHIRKRPGMYIGRLGSGSNENDGIYVLLKEVIDNGIDEFIMGHGKSIDISYTDTTFKVRDYGRGIPHGKLVDCVSRMNTGGKYNSEVFQFSVGLNGVGTKAVNALSSHFRVRSFRDGRFKEAIFREGLLEKEHEGQTTEENGTEVEFEPSREVFPKFKVNYEFIEKRLWNYAYLNRGLSLLCNGARFHSRNGLKDFIQQRIDDDKLYDIIHYRDDRLEFGFTHLAGFGENYFSYVNGQYTNDGGAHQSAFKEALLKAVNEYAGKTWDGDIIRDGIFGAIAVKVQEPVFESQTKNKLGSLDNRAEVIATIKKHVVDFLHKNKSTADRLIEKVTQNEAVRKSIQDIKKNAKENAKKIALRIPKLRDCKHHLCDNTQLGQDSMIFLTEGDSAMGPMTQCRNVLTQALFPLKGKPLNVHGLKIDELYKNEELFCIMKALNIEDNLDNLRYAKVIIATDADDDGMHIRNLLLTYFLTYFEPLVANGHVYILETPLFRVRNKQENIYCYDEDERDTAIRKLGKSAEITRFKGLGEISPKEFGQFISAENMRLIQVGLDRITELPHLLQFYMGKNTPERRNFIMQHLI